MFGSMEDLREFLVWRNPTDLVCPVRRVGRGPLFIKLLYKCPFNPLNKPVMWELFTPCTGGRQCSTLSPVLVSCRTGSAHTSPCPSFLIWNMNSLKLIKNWLNSTSKNGTYFKRMVWEWTWNHACQTCARSLTRAQGSINFHSFQRWEIRGQRLSIFIYWTNVLSFYFLLSTLWGQGLQQGMRSEVSLSS